MESISLLLKKSQGEGSLSRVKVSRIVKILHLFFIDNILIMKNATLEEWMEIKSIPLKINHDIVITENDEINRLIHDTFTPMNDIFDDVHDVPLVDKVENPYMKARGKLLFSILLLENLKVLYCLSNICLP